jgi:hypothetical protein
MEVEVKKQKALKGKEKRDEYNKRLKNAQDIIFGKVDGSIHEINEAKNIIAEDLERKEHEKERHRLWYKENCSGNVAYLKAKSDKGKLELTPADKARIALKRKLYDRKRYQAKKKKEKVSLDPSLERIYARMKAPYANEKSDFYEKIWEEAEDDDNFKKLKVNLEDYRGWIEDTLYDYGKNELLPFLRRNCNGE